MNKIYNGRVTKIYSYGCFVALDGFRRRYEGLVHISNIKNERITSAYEVISRNQHVKVKIISKARNKIGLSMKDVD